MKTVKKYTNELYRQFDYFATWLPGTPLELGDIGLFKNNEFTKISNLKNEGIVFQIKEDTTKTDLEHMTKGEVSVMTKIAGTVPALGSVLANGDAGFSISFSQENAILFKANGTLSPCISDQIKLGKEIIQRYQQGEWDKDWAVITELVTADSATIIISSSQDAKIELKAKADISTAKLDIADASLNLECAFSKDLYTKIVAEQGITPLFKMKKIRSSIFTDPVFKTRMLRPMDLMTPAKAKKSPELLYFDDVDYDLREE
ncbi:MAG TPA: hypothetical protein PKW80_06190 [Bacteroidales bacterium]|nr:hypothetical protein [Bacteroidales bacterium]